MVRSLSLLALLTACGSSQPSTELVGPAAVYEGVVTVAFGTVASVGDRCDLAIRRTTNPSFNCRILLRCGDELVYGLADSGYNACRGDDVRSFSDAEDRHGTRTDGDPRLELDLRRGRVIVSDDDPDLEVIVELERRRRRRGS